MSSDRCPRLFEAEAVRDGRLSGAGRVSFERHAGVCPACAREVLALEALANALCALPSKTADELHVRRERTRLLAGFDRELLAPKRRSSVSRFFAFAAVAPFVAAAVSVLHVRRAGEGARPEDARAVVQADPGAIWSERLEGHRELIALERGTLWIHVDHSRGAGSLLVALPDGELEDTGTTFTVSVDGSRTTRVTVRDGSVVLRVRGRAISVAAGGFWEPPVSEALPAATVEAPSEPAPSALPPGAPSTPHPAAARAREPVRDASDDFQSAMAALNRGDDRDAAARFANFLADHPRDARAEDAAYLRVIALQRSGERRAMTGAAEEYLRRYPAGFRHTEVESVLSPGAP